MKQAHAGGFTLVEIMIVVAIIGLLAAIAIPGLKSSIERARSPACAGNRKNIDGAKMQWALDHRRPLSDTPTEDQLFGAGLYVDHKPDCPAGGAYALHAVEEKCTCSIPPHQ